MFIQNSFISSMLLAAALFATVGRADEAQVAKELTAKGAKITETKGVITAFDLPDPSKWSDDDFKRINELPHLQRISFGLKFNAHQLSLLTNLPEVTTIATNGADLSDADIKQFTQFKKLAVLAFFHPGKSLTGPGLADLATLPAFENLTVGGSSTFGNEGIAAIVKLSHLKSLRIFHTNVDVEGISRLKEIHGLTSITVGQRLTMKPPPELCDDAIPAVVSVKSLESVTLMEARLKLDSLRQFKEIPALKRLTLDGIDIPEADVATLRKELPGVQIKWTAPNEQNMKRIKALFP